MLEFMAKDFDPRDVLAAGIVVSEPKLHFVAADAAGTLQAMEFYGAWEGGGEGGSLVPHKAVLCLSVPQPLLSVAAPQDECSAPLPARRCQNLPASRMPLCPRCPVRRQAPATPTPSSGRASGWRPSACCTPPAAPRAARPSSWPRGTERTGAPLGKGVGRAPACTPALEERCTVSPVPLPPTTKSPPRLWGKGSVLPSGPYPRRGAAASCWVNGPCKRTATMPPLVRSMRSSVGSTDTHTGVPGAV